MTTTIASGVILAALLMASPSIAAGPQEKDIREAYKMILSQADANRDGKLSVDECKAIWKDKKVAEKNCTFWDVDKDGVITETEYVKQASSLGRKK